MKNKYILMHKDIPAASIILDDPTNLIIGYKPINPRYTPFLGTADLQKIKKWWAMRSVPASREMMQHVIRNAGCLNAEGYLAKNLALSMTDTYWICPAGADLTYQDVNLRNFADLSIEKVPCHNAASYDPNASLTGQMEKYWDLGGDVPILVKRSTAHYGQQALNEVFATAVHERQAAGVPYTSYRAERIPDGGYACRCRAFTSDALEFVPAIEVLEGGTISNDTNAYNGYIAICAEHGIPEQVIRNFMDYQTLTDFVVSNEDEHLSNFGILRDPDTMEFISPAPIYDTGNSMFFNEERTQPYTRVELLARKITGFYKTEDKMLQNVRNRKILASDLLPSPEEVWHFYQENGIPEEKAHFLAECYRTKAEMLADFQRGEKISLYDEKRKERTARRQQAPGNSEIHLTVIQGIPEVRNTEITDQLRQRYEQAGIRAITGSLLYPIDKIETDHPLVLDMNQILSEIKQTGNQKWMAYTIINPEEIRKEQEKAGLPDDPVFSLYTAYARTRQAVLNHINVIYAVPHADRKSREDILQAVQGTDVPAELIINGPAPAKNCSRPSEKSPQDNDPSGRFYKDEPDQEEGWSRIIFDEAGD